MKQQTLAVAADQNAHYEQYRRPTRRDAFLATMDQIVPWSQLCEVIEPHYPKAGNGRPPVGLERMLRMYFVQQWFNLADAACEDALLDSTALRRFVGIDLGRERVPDATTLLKFRRLLEKNKLGEALFATVGEVLQARGLKVGVGTIVDATIIGAPSSTKNKDGKRDPEMHQTRKGKQYFFGMKMHIGVDSQSGLVHSAVITAANVHDKHPLPDLLHGQEQRVWGDSAYSSQQGLIRSKAPDAADWTNQKVRKGSPTRTSNAWSTESSPRCGRALNMSLLSSSGCGDSTRCATAAWQRTPRDPSSCWRWPTSIWHAGYCMNRSALKGSRASQSLAARPAMGHCAKQFAPNSR
jgi:IS5 family transposase